MTKIYLVRHANYINPHDIFPGRLPLELSEEGIKEANKLKEYFKDKVIEKVYSSPVKRAEQTAEILSDKRFSIINDLRLSESLSVVQGLERKDWDKYVEELKKAGGETTKEIQDRAVDFFTNTTFEEGKDYILVSHGDPLYFFYEYITNKPLITDTWLKYWGTTDSPDDYQTKGSIRILERKNGNWKVIETINNSDL